MTVTTPKIFAQLKPSDTTNVAQLYTVPAGRRAQVTVFVCNQSSSAEAFRIALVPQGGSPSVARFIAWDASLIGNGVFSVTGIGLDSGESLWVKSSFGNLSFTATGIELS
jgi:hypothetical protein